MIRKVLSTLGCLGSVMLDPSICVIKLKSAYHSSEPKPDIAYLDAAYGYGLAKNHPFNDANKRTALIAMRLFLKLNGYDLAASAEDKYKTIIRVAASNMSEDELAQWISNSLEAIKS